MRQTLWVFGRVMVVGVGLLADGCTVHNSAMELGGM